MYTKIIKKIYALKMVVAGHCGGGNNGHCS